VAPTQDHVARDASSGARNRDTLVAEIEFGLPAPADEPAPVTTMPIIL
jgi:hypothetical protein